MFMAAALPSPDEMGRFHMTLTPGHKHLQILNEKYGDLSRNIESSFTVTAALSLPDVALPTREH